jgi:hypothetical protein
MSAVAAKKSRSRKGSTMVEIRSVENPADVWTFSSQVMASADKQLVPVFILDHVTELASPWARRHVRKLGSTGLMSTFTRTQEHGKVGTLPSKLVETVEILDRKQAQFCLSLSFEAVLSVKAARF